MNDNWLANQMKRIIVNYVRNQGLDNWVKQGWIDSGYTSGKPKVRFVGEDEIGEKTYPYLSSYVPAASDRVLMVRLGKTFIIVGKIL